MKPELIIYAHTDGGEKIYLDVFGNEEKLILDWYYVEELGARTRDFHIDSDSNIFFSEEEFSILYAGSLQNLLLLKEKLLKCLGEDTTIERIFKLNRYMADHVLIQSDLYDLDEYFLDAVDGFDVYVAGPFNQINDELEEGRPLPDRVIRQLSESMFDYGRYFLNFVADYLIGNAGILSIMSYIDMEKYANRLYENNYDKTLTLEFLQDVLDNHRDSSSEYSKVISAAILSILDNFEKTGNFNIEPLKNNEYLTSGSNAAYNFVNSYVEALSIPRNLVRRTLLKIEKMPRHLGISQLRDVLFYHVDLGKLILWLNNNGQLDMSITDGYVAVFI